MSMASAQRADVLSALLMRLVRPLLMLLLLMLFSATAWAHKAGDSYLDLDQQGALLQVRWEVALRDLDVELHLDANDDHKLTWGEVRRRVPEIEHHLWSRLDISQGDKRCQPIVNIEPLSITQRSDGTYALLVFALSCPSNNILTIDYRLLAGIDAQHRGLLTVHSGTQVRSAILQPGRGAMSIRLNASRWQTFNSFVKEGVHHLLTGYDHILFLLTLLLPAVLRRQGQHWQGIERGRDAFWETASVVTAFTVAHSVTLALAALHLIILPSRLVESAIAASIVIAALHNLWPILTRGRWLIAGGFGLIHGFGFASVLNELPLGTGERITALAGFNVGVEMGQLALVFVFLPIAFACRRHAFYSRLILPAGSLLIAFIAFVWLAQRALNLKLIPG